MENANVEECVLADILRATKPDTALDVGANVGQWGDQLLDSGFSGTIISFEVMPHLHAALELHAKTRSPKWSVARCAALGSKQQRLTMNISANGVSSSLLPMLRTHLEAAPNSSYISESIVDVERLDDLAVHALTPHSKIFLKIDTQGYEMEVLKGAEEVLRHTVAIQIELSLVPLYEGAPSFIDATSYLETQGYDLFGLVPVFKDKRNGRLLQVDGLFVRKNVFE